MADLGIEDGRAKKLWILLVGSATPHGIVLLQPAFSKYYLHLGENLILPSSYKENASIFCHTNPWIMNRWGKAWARWQGRTIIIHAFNPSVREED